MTSRVFTRPNWLQRVVAIAVVAIVTCCPRPASAIMIGTPTSEYDFVGLVNGTGVFGSIQATGELIAPDWVLTAGHVVDGLQTATFTINGVEMQVLSMFRDPLYNANTLFTRGHDFGLIHLAAPVTGVALPTLYDGSLGLIPAGGFPVTLVGFGGIDSFGTDSGVLRSGTAFVDRSSSLFIQTSETASGSAAASPGDSGGALMADLGGGEVLAGIHSFASCISRFDCASGAGVVSSGRSFIDSLVQGVQWGIAAPAVAVPEPATGLMMLFGLILVIAAPRRSV